MATHEADGPTLAAITRHEGTDMPLTKPLCGIVPPMVTPLADRDSLDVEGLHRLVEHILTGCPGGLFVLGTTGEGPSLSYHLRRELVERGVRDRGRSSSRAGWRHGHRFHRVDQRSGGGCRSRSGRGRLLGPVLLRSQPGGSLAVRPGDHRRDASALVSLQYAEPHEGCFLGRHGTAGHGSAKRCWRQRQLG